MAGIEINNRTRAKIKIKDLQKIFSEFIKVFKLGKKVYVSLAFVNGAEMKKLNKIYRKKEGITDVLSFSEKSGKSGSFLSDYLGEIIICYPQAKKQAKELKHSVSRELAVLVAHGLVHLMGYDHQTAVAAKKMQVLEKRILRQ